MNPYTTHPCRCPDVCMIRRFSTFATRAKNPNLLELVVGRIVQARQHENADKLYVSQVQVNPSTHIQICSGLAGFIPLPELSERKVVVLANLKASKMRGEISEAMLLAAEKNTDLGTNVELVDPPSNSEVGDHLSFGDYAATEYKRLKSSRWKEISEGLKTDGSRRVVYDDGVKQHILHKSGTPATVKSLDHAIVR